MITTECSWRVGPWQCRLIVGHLETILHYSSQTSFEWFSADITCGSCWRQ